MSAKFAILRNRAKARPPEITRGAKREVLQSAREGTVECCDRPRAGERRGIDEEDATRGTRRRGWRGDLASPRFGARSRAPLPPLSASCGNTVQQLALIPRPERTAARPTMATPSEPPIDRVRGDRGDGGAEPWRCRTRSAQMIWVGAITVLQPGSRNNGEGEDGRWGRGDADRRGEHEQRVVAPRRRARIFGVCVENASCARLRVRSVRRRGDRQRQAAEEQQPAGSSPDADTAPRAAEIIYGEPMV